MEFSERFDFIKKKTIVSLSILLFMLIVLGAGTWYITKSEAFYPEHLKIGKFIAVNNTAKCYIYDAETDTFTGDYFTIHLKTKGFADKGGIRIEEDGQGSLVYDDEKIVRDEMFVMFESNDEYGEIMFIANDVEFKDNGDFVKTGTTYSFLYSSDFLELKSVQIYQDGKCFVIGYVADSLEEAIRVNNDEKQGM